MTPGEENAVRIMAAAARRHESEWSVVATCERRDDGSFQVPPAATPGDWYDFACPLTGVFGQCRVRAIGGAWAQPPRGLAPVLLSWARPGDLDPAAAAASLNIGTTPRVIEIRTHEDVDRIFGPGQYRNPFSLAAAAKAAIDRAAVPAFAFLVEGATPGPVAVMTGPKPVRIPAVIPALPKRRRRKGGTP